MSDNPLAIQQPAAPPPAPIEENDGDLLLRWQAQGMNVASSFPVDDDQGKARMIVCLSTSDRKLKECVNQTLRVVDWFAHVVDYENAEGGEVRTAIRLVLMTDKGERISTGSGPFTKGWGHVMHLYGRGPYNPPLLVEVGQQLLEQGKSYLFIKSCQREARPVETNGKPSAAKQR